MAPDCDYFGVRSDACWWVEVPEGGVFFRKPYRPTDIVAGAEPDGCLISRFPLSGFLDAFVEVPLAFPLLPHHDSTAARLKTTKVSGRGKMK